MTPAAHSKAAPRRLAPVALPLRLGRQDGTDAHLVFDANGDAIGQSYAIVPKLSMDEARQSPQLAPRVEQVQWMVDAVNVHLDLVEALEAILLTSPGRRVTKIATEALNRVKQLKE